MAYIKNFESEEHRHQRMENTPKSNYDAWDNPTVKSKTMAQDTFFKNHIKQYTEFISWCRWFPDLFIDLITPKNSNTHLHFDQRVFLRAICRFTSVYGVFPRGWGKCVSGDTYIFTDKGILPIKSFFNCEENGVEDYTSKLDLQIVNKKYEHEKVDRGTYNGYKDTRKITTNYGYSIECSNNHPLMVLKRNGEIDFVLARNLRAGDKILISTQNDIWSKKSQFFEIDQYGIRKRWALHLPEHLTSDLAYVIGCLVGAGTVSTRSRVSLVTGSENTIARYKHILNRRNIKINDHTKKGVKYKYISYGQGYGDYLKQIDMLNCTKDAQTRHFPDYIMTASKECAVAALRGFFDARVEVNPNDDELTLESQSFELIKQLRLLLLNCGVITKFETRVRRRDGEKNSYLLTISNQSLEVFRKNVGFYDPKKKEALTQIIRKAKRKKTLYDDRYKDNYFIDTIKTVERSKAHVYDISVPDTHSFVSNGFISHNTWGEVLSMFIIAILYPGITMSLTAQTKANAAELLKDKYDEITRQYPLIKNEMYKPRIAKDDFEVNFVNGSRIDVLANAQQSKGQRRNRIQIEESALLDNETFEDALKPIVEVGRTTRGRLGAVDPQELNQSINFFTTAG